LLPRSPPDVSPIENIDRSEDARRKHLQEFGGNVDTENAVEAGLIWIAQHQQPDGSWDRFEFGRLCPPNSRCGGKSILRTRPSLDAGMTGLCLLAFLGAGYTDRIGPHQRTVAAAVNALLAMQEPHGGFSADDAMAGYNDSVATLALAEYLSMTRDERIPPVLHAAIARIMSAQQEQGGWDYGPRPDSGRNDTSITAWAVQALVACRAAGIEFPSRPLVRAALHFDRATQEDGRTWYADAGTGFMIDDQKNEPAYRFGSAMTAAALACEQLLGWSPDSPMIARQRALLLAERPSAAALMSRKTPNFHDHYYWYYGTIGLFQTGREPWQRWNSSLRDAMLPLQMRDKTAAGKQKHGFGSWAPYGEGWGRWGRMGGRVYSTAISVLTLEIYYRHAPAYLQERAALSAADWREYLRIMDDKRRARVAELMTEMRLEIGEPLLVDLLADANRATSLTAARGLAGMDSPLALPVLLDARTAALNELEGERLDRLIRRARAAAQAPPATGKVRLHDPAAGLATLELSRAHIGMTLKAGGDGNRRSLRVIQRFSTRPMVIAEVLDPSVGGPLRQGDPVLQD